MRPGTVTLPGLSWLQRALAWKGPPGQSSACADTHQRDSLAAQKIGRRSGVCSTGGDRDKAEVGRWAGLKSLPTSAALNGCPAGCGARIRGRAGRGARHLPDQNHRCKPMSLSPQRPSLLFLGLLFPAPPGPRAAPCSGHGWTLPGQPALTFSKASGGGNWAPGIPLVAVCERLRAAVERLNKAFTLSCISCFPLVYLETRSRDTAQGCLKLTAFPPRPPTLVLFWFCTGG